VSELAHVTTHLDLPSSPHFIADFLEASAILHVKRPFCVFQPPSGGLGATYDVHFRLNGKRVVNFLLVFIEPFSLDVTVEALRTKID